MGALIDLPLSIPVLTGWVAWLTAGLALVVWARHTRNAWAEAPMPAPRLAPVRPKSAVRPPKVAPPAQDAFGELEAMLDPAPSESRTPDDRL